MRISDFSGEKELEIIIAINKKADIWEGLGFLSMVPVLGFLFWVGLVKPATVPIVIVGAISLALSGLIVYITHKQTDKAFKTFLEERSKLSPEKRYQLACYFRDKSHNAPWRT